VQIFCCQDTRHAAGWGERKLKLISEYKFVIVFENAVTEDYVTEKLFHAFLAGAVPVVSINLTNIIQLLTRYPVHGCP
jgi:hypothetical protein